MPGPCGGHRHGIEPKDVQLARVRNRAPVLQHPCSVLVFFLHCLEKCPVNLYLANFLSNAGQLAFLKSADDLCLCWCCCSSGTSPCLASRCCQAWCWSSPSCCSGTQTACSDTSPTKQHSGLMAGLRTIDELSHPFGGQCKDPLLDVTALCIMT